METPFYVGYQRRAPASLGRFLHALAAALVVLAALVGAALATLQGPFEPGTFAWGHPASLEGTLRELPYPHLVMAAGRVLLVGPGKHGAADLVAGLDGRRVRLLAAPIERRGTRLAEVVPGSVRALDNAPVAASPSAGEDLGTWTLSGEVVDGKCWAGVMKPGRGIPHRACAALCLRGGTPALLVVRGPAGEPLPIALVGPGGRPLPGGALPVTGTKTTLTGGLRRDGDLLWMGVDAASIRILDEKKVRP